MAAKTRATVEDLERVPENGKAELIGGELIRMSPTGVGPGRANGRIYRSLAEHEERTETGYAIPDNVGFLVSLPNRESFSPDAAFFVGDLPPAGDFISGAPVFAVEVRSKNDYGSRAERDITQKIADYFAAGTQVVWDVDVLRNEEIRVFRAPNADVSAAVFRHGEVADAEPALPGWSFPVGALFRR